VAAALKLLGAQSASKGAVKAANADSGGDSGKADTKKATDPKEKAADADSKPSGELDALNLLSAGVQAPLTNANQSAKDQPQGDTVYRFSRADGTGKSVDMSLPAADGSGSKDTGATNVEHVTVLDARRFLSDADSVSANTKALVSGMSGDKDWSAAMKAASSANASSTLETNRVAAPVNTLKIQMTPADLGTVTATLRLQGEQLTVHLTVDNAEAYKHLTQDKEGLVQSLKAQGFSVDQVNIQLTTTSTADRGVAQTASSQQSGGQQMQDGSAGQFAQQGQSQDNSRRQQSNGFNSNTQFADQAAGSDGGADSSSDGARSGQVYL
jgi:chemotaxis protein MotD